MAKAIVARWTAYASSLVQSVMARVNLATALRTMATAIILLVQTGIHCRSVLRAQGGTWYDCIASLSALRRCTERSLQLCGILCFGPNPGNPNLNASPPTRLRRLGPRITARMWLVPSDVGVIAPFPFFSTYVSPPKRRRPYSRPLCRSCESSLPQVGPVIISTLDHHPDV